MKKLILDLDTALTYFEPNTKEEKYISIHRLDLMEEPTVPIKVGKKFRDCFIF